MAQMAGAIRLRYLSINLRHYPVIDALLNVVGRFLIPKKIIEQQTDYCQRTARKLERRL